MLRRAIILVPAFEKREQLSARDQLVEAILNYTEGWKTTAEDPKDSDGQNVTFVHAEPRKEGDELTIGIYEAYWGDLVPDWSSQSPWRRLRRGTSLLGYWTIGGIAKAMIRRKLPSRVQIAMAVAAFLLIWWYICVVLVIVQAIAAGDLSLQLAEPVLPETVKDSLENWAKEISNWPVVIAVMGLVGLGSLEKISNIAAYTKAYLQDKPDENEVVGLRAKTRRRVISMLDHVHGLQGDKAYDEVFLVAHSLGGAIAVDALGQYGKGLENTSLVTWGTAIGLLAQQDPWIEREIEKLRAAEPGIHSWEDVVFKKDYLASKVPPADPDPTAEKDGSDPKPPVPHLTEPGLPKGISFLSKRIHNGYYACEEALQHLLMPVATRD